jgi:hypothetical protein
VPIVLDHLGGPLAIGPYASRREEVLAAWRTAMRAVAACPNVTLKLGGIGMPTIGPDWRAAPAPPTSEDVAAEWGPSIRFAIEAFGADRCMFESNFPVDGWAIGYVVLWNAFKRITAGAGAGERDDLVRGTATRVYRLDPARRRACPGGAVTAAWRGYDASTYGEGFADVYDEWYGDPAGVDATVDVLADLAAGGPVLELGVGTGRLAIPSPPAGWRSTGWTPPPPWWRPCATSRVASGWRSRPADSPTWRWRSRAASASPPIAFNTLFQPPDRGGPGPLLRQRRPAAAARRRFVVEAFVPDPESAPSGAGLTTRSVDVDHVELQATVADLAAQTISGSTISITEAGIRLRPWHVRWCTPDQLDEMATAAGLARWTAGRAGTGARRPRGRAGGDGVPATGGVASGTGEPTPSEPPRRSLGHRDR